MEGTIVAKNYKITKKLGNGAFGEIWKATNLKINEGQRLFDSVTI